MGPLIRTFPAPGNSEVPATKVNRKFNIVKIFCLTDDCRLVNINNMVCSFFLKVSCALINKFVLLILPES